MPDWTREEIANFMYEDMPLEAPAQIFDVGVGEMLSTDGMPKEVFLEKFNNAMCWVRYHRLVEVESVESRDAWFEELSDEMQEKLLLKWPIPRGRS